MPTRPPRHPPFLRGEPAARQPAIRAGLLPGCRAVL